MSPALNEVMEHVINVIKKDSLRIWEPKTNLCHLIATYNDSFVIMYSHVTLNCDNKILFFLKNKNMKMQNIFDANF